ncbi:hypothetical protein WS70_12970 [Burkholderia mayonis]|uniref:Uncharacterized protein n=2 Tax=Burkholderiaceae TaxID=119060 RepID=A0A1B4FG20_9BURK|nr:hypothetical protein WS70_12970 [Burkholderia mayonis]KVE40859.1 hypothetical protein WS69_28335 [Burkholderia sp. BDU5]KVE41730.1 hypothetical protein WS70_12935 [Burkholderia mayonis]
MLVVPGKPLTAPHTVFMIELEGAVLDVGDGLENTGRSLADPMVLRIDAITDTLWSSGDDNLDSDSAALFA